MPAAEILDDQLAAAVQVFEQGDLKRALQMAQALCQHYPDSAIVHNVYGVMAAEQGQVATAIDSYRASIALDADNADVHFNLANALRATGDRQAALASYRTALALRPNDREVVLNMATVLRGLGQFGEAGNLFQQLLKASPEDHAAHNGLGLVLLQVGRADDAIASLRQAVKLQPRYAEAHDNLCEALEKTNQTDALRQAVAAARAVFRPDAIWLAIRQAQVLRRDRDLGEALKALLQVQTFNPGQAQLNSTYWYLRGDINDRLGDLQVREPRHDHVGPGLRLAQQRVDQRPQPRDRGVGLVAHPHPEVERHLVVARPARMQPSGGGADQHFQTGFDIHMDVLQSGRKLECPALDL